MVRCFFYDECENADTEKCEDCMKVVHKFPVGKDGHREYMIRFRHLKERPKEAS